MARNNAKPPVVDIMPEELVELLRTVNRPLSFDGIMKILHVPRRRKKHLDFLLHTLEAQGTIAKAHGNWFFPQKRVVVSGILAMQRTGAAFVCPESDPVGKGPGRGESAPAGPGEQSGPKGGSRAEQTAGGRGDIYISPQDMGEAWDGDRVEVLVLPGRRPSPDSRPLPGRRPSPGRSGPSREGRVLKVLSRSQKPLAVRAIQAAKKGSGPTGEGTLWTCTPLAQGIQAIFSVDISLLEPSKTPYRPEQAALSRPAVQADDILLVRPLEKNGPGLWRAEALHNLHNERSPASQELLAKINHGIPLSFPEPVVREAKAFPRNPEEKDFAGRRDLRDLCLVTIDGEDARDYDDAIFVERLEPGGQYRLVVAIADVSHYVRPFAALDREARLRGNSCYFPLSVEPMLPEALSNGLCSLLPHTPRLALVADMRFDGEGRETFAEYYPAVIESRARLTYDAVFQALVKGEAEARADLHSRHPSLLPMLESALALAKILSAMRKTRGNLDFDLPEARFFFDENGAISGVAPRAHHAIHRLIEECMVAANESVARFLTARGAGLLYRAHPAPDGEKLEALVAFLGSSGLMSGGGPVRLPKKRGGIPAPDARTLSALLDRVRGAPQEFTVNRLLLRAMMQARYTPEHEGHYGLASSCYCHFTSPIRRYADLVVHRVVKAVLGSPEGKGAIPKEQAFLAATAEHINQTERAAMEAEREVHKRLAALFLEGRVGEEFDGVVSGVSDFGIFVELKDCLTEGMIRLGALHDDYYEYHPDKQLLRGRHSGREFGVGAPLRVQLVNVSLSRLEIDLLPVDEEDSADRRHGPVPEPLWMQRERRPGNKGASRSRAKARGSRAKGGTKTTAGRGQGGRRKP